MPQLNPSPWFYIMLSTWILLILITPIKITQLRYLNHPLPKTTLYINKPWLWPWT
uniref:ATP synthase complex subunit 8 n=1 Tax=Pristimantis fenestratus TaxID=448655 RepID=A0A0S2A2S8_9NEOB|nr:ATP synthase F0 subunit 8 [Pristimantis fenestratus]